MKTENFPEQDPVTNPVMQSPDNLKDEMLIKQMFSKVLTRQLEHAEGSHVGCINHVFEVWYQLLKDRGIDMSEHFERKDELVLNSLQNPIDQVLGVVLQYYKLYQEALENDLVVNNFLKNVILKPHRTRAKRAINRLVGYTVWE